MAAQLVAPRAVLSSTELVSYARETYNSLFGIVDSNERRGTCSDRLYGLVVRVPGSRPRGLVLDSRRYLIFLVAVGLERGPLSLVRINEELQ
jgi:hypothetical protein